MDAGAEVDLAGWLAEAFETGNALAPVPGTHAPASLGDGEAVAALVLDRLGMVACGVRLAPGPGGAAVAGPMIEGRLLAPKWPVALAALRHPMATAAVVAVLGQPLESDGEGPPVIERLHPAIDIAAGRLREPHATPAMQAADLGGLGMVVAARGSPAEGMLAQPAAVALAVSGRRSRPDPIDLVAALGRAAAAARRLGGLPAGAILVVAGLSPPLAPVPGLQVSARLTPLGRVAASFG